MQLHVHLSAQFFSLRSGCASRWVLAMPIDRHCMLQWLGHRAGVQDMPIVAGEDPSARAQAGQDICQQHAATQLAPSYLRWRAGGNAAPRVEVLSWISCS